MSSENIYRTFFCPLPNILSVDKSAVYRKVSTTSTSTKAEEPLRALRSEDPILLLDRGRDHLLRIRQANSSILHQSTNIPLKRTIKTEADIMTQSILHLFYPINHIINTKLKDGHIESHLEWTQKGNMRADYQWMYYPPSGALVHFAVLEMKAPHLLSWDDFKVAIATTDDEESELLESAHYEASGTLLVENGKIFIQQVKKYLKNLKVKDVAIFDWISLVIVDTEGLDEDTSRHRLARLSWFSENGKEYEAGAIPHPSQIAPKNDLLDMNYPCVKLFSGENVSFSWNISFEEVQDADLEAFLFHHDNERGLQGPTIALNAADNARIAAMIMTSNQKDSFEKIYQAILNDISRLCGPELALLCAAALGKHKMSHLNKDGRHRLLDYLKKHKSELNVSGLAALVDMYKIPRRTPGISGPLAPKETWDEGPGTDTSDSPNAPAMPYQDAVDVHTDPSEICLGAATSVAAEESNLRNSSASPGWGTLPAPVSPDTQGGSDCNLLFVDHGDETTQAGLQNDWDVQNIDAPGLNVYVPSNDENLWCDLHTEIEFGQRH
ncbi:hypothetical protein BO94DRAFT_629321 [Aspergillus sclerotioniger CBS 115572]|uniref:Uncharacterized protein n=1 Tax=Aspergillus sclerotioniger CBS 115572 TaxID=1450535 RepID=A0A317UWR2_9EURO|nr:hypothetical protein BO94DRAFT_629321 [Aspergillus sclerotioniger CBS 115572]PWY64967.1 hypothetical protein BO94DRAFT_629321 [Aspergillus sclerotioniger CBS 115572]